MEKNKLLFEDIIDDLTKVTNKTWQILYDFTKENGNDNAYFSALVNNDKEDIEQVLKDCFRNGVDLDFSKPSFFNCEDGICYNNEHYDFNTYYEPIVIYQNFDIYWDDQIDLCEEFKLYHNLYFDSKTMEYLKINQDGDKEVVAKIEVVERGKRLKVRTLFLRDYLAAKNMVLVLFYDIIRINEPSKEDKEKRIKKRGDNFYFEIIFEPNNTFLNTEKPVNYSNILGKTILKPFDEPKHPSYLFFKKDKTEPETINVIVGCNENGENIFESCTKKHYPNPINYLRTVFFKKEVLEKYYDNPEKYSVEPELIRGWGKWTLHFNTNNDGFVHVYLGDLAKIPNNEKYHWKQYNVPPEGGISRVSFQRDFLAEPADTEDIIHILKAKYFDTNKLWMDSFSFELFCPLREEDKASFESLMIPPNDSQLKFDRQILSLSKIFPDSLNKNELLKLIDESEVKRLLNISEDSQVGSIKVFQAFLIKILGFDKETANSFILPLITTQDLRSNSSAHRKGNNFVKVSKKYGLDNISNSDFLEKLFSDFVKMLETIQEKIKTHRSNQDA